MYKRTPISNSLKSFFLRKILAVFIISFLNGQNLLTIYLLVKPGVIKSLGPAELIVDRCDQFDDIIAKISINRRRIDKVFEIDYLFDGYLPWHVLVLVC